VPDAAGGLRYGHRGQPEGARSRDDLMTDLWNESSITGSDTPAHEAPAMRFPSVRLMV
jgi:hypothetical protein